MTLRPELKRYLDDQVLPDLPGVPRDRWQLLEPLAKYVQGNVGAGRASRLVYICTHNSRRSHFGQVWAAVAASYYRVPQVVSYSGGTEATAFNPRAVAALKRAGLAINAVAPGPNPRYSVSFDDTLSPLSCFSKRYDDAENPGQGFAAIMTCSEADAACPLVPGALLRISIPYEDPKRADDTPAETER
jgi:hypothetical protein